MQRKPPPYRLGVPPVTARAWVAILCMVVGTLGVLRGVVIVAGGGHGRFRFDASASLIAGFSLMLLGQYLFDQA